MRCFLPPTLTPTPGYGFNSRSWRYLGSPPHQEARADGKPSSVCTSGVICESAFGRQGTSAKGKDVFVFVIVSSRPGCLGKCSQARLD